jgi:polyphosphate kinase 2 (PPK2 family)
MIIYGALFSIARKGKICRFNRTHYENVLVTRVHPEYINENLPGLEDVSLITDAFWEKRMEQIRNFEKHITENGTIVNSFYISVRRSRETFIEAFRRKNTIGSSQWGFERKRTMG